MGKSAPAAPEPPDPYATARAQTGSNVSTAVANTVLGNANETGPLGSVRYNQNGSYKLDEPVLDKNGAPVTTRKWVADEGAGAMPNDPQYRVYQAGSSEGGGVGGGNQSAGRFIDSRTGADWSDLASSGGGRWVEEQQTSSREIPMWERITTLSPQEQAKYDRQNEVQINLLDLANSQSRRLQDTLASPLNLDGLPDARNSVNGPQMEWNRNVETLSGDLGDTGSQLTNFGDVRGPQRTVGPNDFSADRRRVEDALYQRLNPQLERDRAALETQLVNQGFTRGTEAYRNELDSSNRQANDARLGVIAAGGQEQSRLTGLLNDKFTLENAAQGQEFTQAAALTRVAQPTLKAATGQQKCRFSGVISSAERRTGKSSELKVAMLATARHFGGARAAV